MDRVNGSDSGFARLIGFGLEFDESARYCRLLTSRVWRVTTQPFSPRTSGRYQFANQVSVARCAFQLSPSGRHL
jgi:hypothetical protein